MLDRRLVRVKGKLVLPLVLPPPERSRAAGNRGQILLSHARIKLPSPSQHEEDGSSAWSDNRWKKEQDLTVDIAARTRLNYGTYNSRNCTVVYKEGPSGQLNMINSDPPRFFRGHPKHCTWTFLHSTPNGMRLPWLVIKPATLCNLNWDTSYYTVSMCKFRDVTSFKQVQLRHTVRNICPQQQLYLPIFTTHFL